MTTCNNMAPAGEIPASTEEGSEVTCAYQSGTANTTNDASIEASITPPPSPPPPSPPQEDEDDEDGEAIDFSKQKKRKGVKKKEKSVAVVDVTDEGSVASKDGKDGERSSSPSSVVEDAEDAQARAAAADESHGYSYSYLLGRLRSNLAKDCPSHPSLQDAKQGSKVPPPRLAMVGGRRVAICNFGTICDALQRPRAHAQRFLLAELQTSGSLDKEEETLTLLARLSTAAVEQLVRKYIREYATCRQCKSHQTTLLKAEKKGAGEWIRCGCCGAEAVVEPIKVGFTAVRRGERRANRE